MRRSDCPTARVWRRSLRIVDEFATLLDLKDFGWACEGRISVDLGIGLVAARGTSFSAAPLLRRWGATRTHRS